MKWFITFILCCPFLGLMGYRIYADIDYDRHVEGYLKRAADANTTDIAKTQLDIAIAEIESRHWTTGYTSIFYTTPDEDIAFWYNNLKASSDELAKITPESPQLEKSNVLMKLRETLLDQHSTGVSITAPSGISVYPMNTPLFWCGAFSFLIAVVSCGFLIVDVLG